jgi:O-antigen ligase
MLLLWLGMYKKQRRWLDLIGAVLLLWLEYKTYSRSAWVGTAAALLVFGWLSIKDHVVRKKVFIRVAVGMVVLAAAIAVVLPQSPKLQSIILHNQHSDTDIGSTEAHAQAGVASLDRIAEQPLGYGPGAAGPASFYGSEPRIPENYYLQIAEEAGLVGLAIFAAINLLVFSRVWHLRREWWPRILIASFVGISVINLFLHGWADDTSALLWWGMAGLFTLKK